MQAKLMPRQAGLLVSGHVRPKLEPFSAWGSKSSDFLALPRMSDSGLGPSSKFVSQDGTGPGLCGPGLSLVNSVIHSISLMIQCHLKVKIN